MDRELEVILKGNAFSNVLKKELEVIQKKHGLKRVELEVLYFLAEFPEYDTPSQAAQMLQLTRGHVSQAVDVLIEKDLIMGTADERDRRSVHYTPTENANPILLELGNERTRLETQLFEGISEEDRKVLRRIMTQVQKNAVKIAEEVEEMQEKQ